MKEPRRHEAAEFLSVLENREAELLSWGITQGAFSAKELEEVAEKFIEERELYTRFEDAWELVEELLEQKFLFRLPYASEEKGERYRTRMAEGIRLFSQLRQLFDQKKFDDDWAQAKALVADFRLLLKPREYPKRIFTVQDVLKKLGSLVLPNSLREQLLHAMLGPNSERAYELELADFQFESTKRIFECDAQGKEKGTIVCAGTGSGKTLSFYLPAMILIAEKMETTSWVQCLALYPRNELLKDQLNEACAQARSINNILMKHKGRKLRIGALFGSVPDNANVLIPKNKQPGKWGPKQNDGYVCPYLRCPKCSGSVLWTEQDILQNQERLRCINSNCQTIIQDDEVVFTRKKMLEEPPDILFTTTEMLNQRLSDSSYNGLFGCGMSLNKKPHMVLFDEAHTYEGLNGAQVALLTRRWRNKAKTNAQYIGLSATLRDATSFFSRLVGIDQDNVEEIQPQQMVKEGREYMLALQGDPVSRTSLLSTTIQASMLMRRLLQPEDQAHPFAGSRVFVFTDDLNVTNRLYFDLKDAEGRDGWDRPKTAGSLANLRDRLRPRGNQKELYEQGQRWDLVQAIGHRLDVGTTCRVSRTSSQDTGVDVRADMIVATASLEVGYNDQKVGAMIQHKSPMDVAQFLQRKGRAGRLRMMRPWTVVVLSDYGRDRAAYQNYDRLFAPELPPRSIPLQNRYVLRMQATYALLDWLDEGMASSKKRKKGSVWMDSARPFGADNYGKDRRALLQSYLEGVLEDAEERKKLQEWLCRSLLIENSEAEVLMWSPPRSLLFHVVPTLLRRLETNWRMVNESLESLEREDYQIRNNPLPEFVPANLFSDLNLPEAEIYLLPQEITQNEPIRIESMGVYKALREFAPGRISKRFAVRREDHAFWIVPNSFNPPTQNIELQDYCGTQFEYGEPVRYLDGNDLMELPMIRPYRLLARQAPPDYKDSSNAFLDWRSQLVIPYLAEVVDVPPVKPWGDFFVQILSYTHATNSPVEIRRYAIGSVASIQPNVGESLNVRFRFTHNQQPISVGFAYDIDALCFRVAIPDDLVERVRTTPALLRALRVRFYEETILHDPALNLYANVFQRGWLMLGYLSALTGIAIHNSCTLSEARTKLHREGEFEGYLVRALEALFRFLDRDEIAPSSGIEPQVLQELRAILSIKSVKEQLYAWAEYLWNPPEDLWSACLARCYVSTIAAATLEACQQMCPDLDTSELLLDLNLYVENPQHIFPKNQAEFWLTESSPGGTGIIEEILKKYREFPQQFYLQVTHALGESDFEVVDRTLTRIVAATQSDTVLQQAFRDFRQALGLSHEDLQSAFERIQQHVTSMGLPLRHSTNAALQMRVLRPASSECTDKLLHQLLEGWTDFENKLGIEIDPRVWAYMRSRFDDLGSALSQALLRTSQTSLSQSQQFSAIYGLLWPRGYFIREQGLATHNLYTRLPFIERLLVEPYFQREILRVRYTDQGWKEKLYRVLEAQSEALLIIPDAQQTLMEELFQLLTEPIDQVYLLLYPEIQGIQYDKDGTTIHFVLPMRIR